MSIDPQRLTILCQQLEPFGSLLTQGGQAWRMRSFRCTPDTLAGTIAQLEAEEDVSVERFPEGYKVRFVRSLDVGLLAGENATASG